MKRVHLPTYFSFLGYENDFDQVNWEMLIESDLPCHLISFAESLL
jgi:hypothetical protein